MIYRFLEAFLGNPRFHKLRDLTKNRLLAPSLDILSWRITLKICPLARSIRNLDPIEFRVHGLFRSRWTMIKYSLRLILTEKRIILYDPARVLHKFSKYFSINFAFDSVTFSTVTLSRYYTNYSFEKFPCTSLVTGQSLTRLDFRAVKNQREIVNSGVVPR